MKKTPSVFKRDYEGTRLVFADVVEGCEWVLAGEGVPTVKWDGTCCMVRGGKLFKRYDRKQNKPAPPGWEAAEEEANEHTGHWPGWLPVGDGPEDRWHREAFGYATSRARDFDEALEDGTYELCGPKVQGNPHGFETHVLVRHGTAPTTANPRTFEEIRDYLKTANVEGIVWHHPDGRLAKIKTKDFGFKWPPETEE